MASARVGKFAVSYECAPGQRGGRLCGPGARLACLGLRGSAAPSVPRARPRRESPTSRTRCLVRRDPEDSTGDSTGPRFVAFTARCPMKEWPMFHGLRWAVLDSDRRESVAEFWPPNALRRFNA